MTPQSHRPATQKTLDLLEPEQIWKASLLAKVHGLIDERVYDHLASCGVVELYRTCKECRDWQTFYYRCNLKFCPLCNWRIARARAELLKHWVWRVQQPKHIVLTCRNSEFLRSKTLRRFGLALARLRRAKLWRDVKGGCVSIEITNEGRGWHIHAHILADVRWIDAGELSKKWGKLVGQDFAIVKIKDARGQDYLGEITKYVVKASQLVSWPENEIAEFIHAIKGKRFFATFGSLFKLRQQIRAEIDEEKPPPPICKCGCSDFWFEDEATTILREHREQLNRKAR